jgi:hypothetical protein
MTGDPRRRHRRGEAVEQLQRRQQQRAVPAQIGLGALVEQALGIEFAPPVQGKRTLLSVNPGRDGIGNNSSLL